MEDVLTVFKASQYCSVSPKTIINWVESGHIKAYKTVGGHRRINKVDLETFMKKQGIPIPDGAPVETKKRMIDHWKIFIPINFFTRFIFAIIA